MSDVCYCTMVTTQDYVIGALTLCKSLRKHTKIPIVCIVNKHIEYSDITLHFDHVLPVEPLKCNDNRIEMLERPLESALTKLYAWTLDYDKVVYLDADMLVRSAIDSLFDRPSFSAVTDIGWPDCFNSGLMVLTPSYSTFEELKYLAKTQGSFDGADQGLLNDYFTEWQRIPFVYNCTLSLHAVYSYKPAFLRHQDNVKIVHFFGQTKPWHHYHTESFLQGMLDEWWSTCQETPLDLPEQPTVQAQQAQPPSHYNQLDEPRLMEDMKTMMIGKKEYLVDNNQDIPVNPKHHTFDVSKDKRQKDLNVSEMQYFTGYKCTWDYAELYGTKLGKPKK